MKRSLYIIAIIFSLFCLGNAQAEQAKKYNLVSEVSDINRGKLGTAEIFIQDMKFYFTKDSKVFLKSSRSSGISRLKIGMKVGIVLEEKTEDHIKRMMPNLNIKEIWILD